MLNFPGGFAMSRSLPGEAVETWHDQLGSIHREELDRTELFLWAIKRSNAPGIIDAEYRTLAVRVHQLYLGLLLALPYLSNGRVTSLSGANADGYSRARQLTWYARTYYTVGSPVAGLTIERAKHAAQVARALSRHPRSPSHRMVRVLRTFRKAAECMELDDRLHQFVRVIEGFLGTRNGKEFAARGAHFVSGRWSRDSLEEMYAMRGAIEHLRGPFAEIGMARRPVRHRVRSRPSGRPAGGRLRRLIRRTIEAEIIARYLLFQYFTTGQLWRHFANERTLSDFWGSHTTRSLRDGFGGPIPLDRIEAAIDDDEISRAITRSRRGSGRALTER
jgi:hypothetical protein